MSPDRLPDGRAGRAAFAGKRPEARDKDHVKAMFRP